MKRRLSSLLGVFLIPAMARASPEDLYGYGAEGQAMGATGAALARGYEAAWANPALGSRVRRYRLALGMQGSTFALDAPDRVTSRSAKGFVIGGDIPVPFGGPLKDRVGVVLAFYTPSDALVRGRILYPETPQFGLFSDRAQCLTVRAGFGVDIGWGLRVGAGFGALAQIVGSVIVATDATGRVGTRVENQLVTTYAPTFGASWETKLAEGTLRVGVTFRGKLDARFAVLIDASKLSTLPIPLLNIGGLAQFDPHQLALEAGYERGPWRFTAGATYKHWSDYPGPWEPTLACPEDQPDCGALVPPKIGFSSTIVPRAGAERSFALGADASAALRAGMFLEPSPLPSSIPASGAHAKGTAETAPMPTRFFDATRVALTFGGGVRYKDVALDGFAQLHALAPREVDLEAGARTRISGFALAAGLTLGVAF